MKVVDKPIEVICWFDLQGVHPIRFRITEDDSTHKVIKINIVITKQIEKLAGNMMWVFDCQSNIYGIMRPFQLKYELLTCKWMFFKI